MGLWAKLDRKLRYFSLHRAKEANDHEIEELEVEEKKQAAKAKLLAARLEWCRQRRQTLRYELLRFNARRISGCPPSPFDKSPGLNARDGINRSTHQKE